LCWCSALVVSCWLVPIVGQSFGNHRRSMKCNSSRSALWHDLSISAPASLKIGRNGFLPRKTVTALMLFIIRNSDRCVILTMMNENNNLLTMAWQDDKMIRTLDEQT
jgi:hypothetical protein